MDVYKKIILDRLPQILSHFNRNKYSFSFGCFDRNFWHYKIVDIPSARFQEGVLILALIYIDSEIQFFQKKKIKEWIEGALQFWLKIQNRDGSFNEWYPQEKSFVATAFSSYAISETLLLVSDIKKREKVVFGLKRAADWLIGKREKQALNQNAGALAALYNIFLLTGDRRYQKESERFLEFLKKSQNEEGWFFEYGGPDIGYLSLTLDYLAKYYLKSKDKTVFPLVEKGLFFLSHFIHPDGSAGGIYGSRNTAYLIPSGIEILANFMPLARKISSVLQEGIRNNYIISAKIFDDRYLIQNGYTYLEASWQLKQRNFKEEKEIALPHLVYGEKHFPQAGILIKSTPRFYCIISYKKGGAFYFYDRIKKIGIYNSGLLLKFRKKLYTSCYLSSQNKIFFSPNKETFFIKGKLKEVIEYYPTPLRFIALRILLGIAHFIPYFAAALKSIFRFLLISKKAKSFFCFERSFHFDDNVVIKDKFPPGIFDGGRIGGILELIYTPSSRYFNPNVFFSKEKPIEKKELEEGEVEYLL